MPSPEKDQQSNQFELSPEQQAALDESHILTATEIQDAIERARLEKIRAQYVTFITAPSENNLFGVAIRGLGNKAAHLYDIDPEDPNARRQLLEVADEATQRFSVIEAAIEPYTPVLQMGRQAYRGGHNEASLGITTHKGFHHIGNDSVLLKTHTKGLYLSNIDISGRELHKYTAIDGEEAQTLAKAPEVTGEVAWSTTFIGRASIVGFLETSQKLFPDSFDPLYVERELVGVRGEHFGDEQVIGVVDELTSELVTRGVIAPSRR